MRVSTAEDLSERSEGSRVRMAGVISGLEAKVDKVTGKVRMARFHVEDKTGVMSAFVFGSVFDRFEGLFRGNEALIVDGSLVVEEEGETLSRSLKVESLSLLASVAEETVSGVELVMEGDGVDTETLRELEGLVRVSGGKLPVQMDLVFRGLGRVRVDWDENHRMSLDENLLCAVLEVVGERGVHFVTRRGN